MLYNFSGHQCYVENYSSDSIAMYDISCLSVYYLVYLVANVPAMSHLLTRELLVLTIFVV